MEPPQRTDEQGTREGAMTLLQTRLQEPPPPIFFEERAARELRSDRHGDDDSGEWSEVLPQFEETVTRSAGQ